VVDPHRSGGDQARWLVLYLTHTHTHTDAFLLDGDTVEHAALRPHGLWGSDQSLRHRHDGDIAGQRAPLDHAYLDRVVPAAVAAIREREDTRIDLHVSARMTERDLAPGESVSFRLEIGALPDPVAIAAFEEGVRS
jgi:hypothetical protein